MKRGYEIAAFAFLAAYAALHVAAGLAVPGERLWGADIMRFCRGWQVGVFACLVAGSLGLAWPAFAAQVEAAVAWLGSRLGARGSRLPLTHAVLFVVSAAALFLLGTEYSGGDASWMWEAGKLPLFLKRSPLSSAPLVVGTWAGGALGAGYLPSLQATITLVGALSVCGLFQLFLTLFGDRARAWAFVAVALSSYGMSRLLPGYIEVYGVTLLFLILFECALVSYCLRGRGLVLLLAALGAFVLAHIQALVAVPGVFVLGVARERRRKRLWRFLALWALLALVLAGLYPLLKHRGQSFDLGSALVQLVQPGEGGSRFWSTNTDEGGPLVAPARVLLSGGHWLNVLNVHLLVSGIGLGLLAPGLVLWRRAGKGDALIAMSAANYALYFAGTVLFYNYFQPVERDWDMFGPGALYLVVLAAALWRGLPTGSLRRALLIVLPVAGWVTLLWLAQQAGVLGVAPPPAIRVSFALPG
ncbi:MAG: hypothetical protein FJ290_09135 [Planctomycetes bacterium]|nr:hypothetical protein [Planctomycetota bacterium]